MSKHDNPSSMVAEDGESAESESKLEVKPETAFALEDEPEEKRLSPEVEAKIAEIKERGEAARVEFRSGFDALTDDIKGWEGSDSPLESEVGKMVAAYAKRLDKARPQWLVLPMVSESIGRVMAGLEVRIDLVKKFNAQPEQEKDFKKKARLAEIIMSPLEEGDMIFTKPGWEHSLHVYSLEGMAKDRLREEK